MLTDTPIHLKQYSFCNSKSQRDDYVVVPTCLTQEWLDGLNALIHYCDGVEAAGKGKAPGSFELKIFYRNIKSCLDEAERKKSKELKG